MSRRKNVVKSPRILVLDIETAPILARVWGVWQQNIPWKMMEHDWYILAFSAKWLNDPRVMYWDQRDAPIIEDDKALLGKLWELLNEADVVIAHNGKRFDLRKINARLILNGYAPPSPYRVLDTLLEARRTFSFSNNKLEALTDMLCEHEKKSEHSKFPGYELWDQCLKGNPEAWEEMRKYNIRDVTSLEELYLKLRPWIEGHPNVGAFTDPDEVTCPRCGSHRLIKKGFRFTQVGKYSRFLCLDCHGWSRGRLTENTKEQRANLLIQ